LNVANTGAVPAATTLHAASLYVVTVAVTDDPVGITSTSAPRHDDTEYCRVDGGYTHAPPSDHEKSTGMPFGDVPRPAHLLSPYDATTSPWPALYSSSAMMSDICDAGNTTVRQYTPATAADASGTQYAAAESADSADTAYVAVTGAGAGGVVATCKHSSSE
jgi:hypothetical protein